MFSDSVTRYRLSQSLPLQQGRVVGILCLIPSASLTPAGQNHESIKKLPHSQTASGAKSRVTREIAPLTAHQRSKTATNQPKHPTDPHQRSKTTSRPQNYLTYSLSVGQTPYYPTESLRSQTVSGARPRLTCQNTSLNPVSEAKPREACNFASLTRFQWSEISSQ